MKLKEKKIWSIFLALFTLFFLTSRAEFSQAQTIIDPSPPEQTVEKSVASSLRIGENWLADDQGGLGLALQDSNYFVSDTYYGWGPGWL